MKKKSEEEKQAEKIAKILDSGTLDFDEVGKYLARMRTFYYNRLMIVAESAEWEKEGLH